MSLILIVSYLEYYENLVSRLKMTQLQGMIDRLTMFSKMLSLDVDLDKSEIMIKKRG